MLKVQGRPLVRLGYELNAPLMGSIAYGLIDRGTNVIQVRPVSYCPLNCVFCSTDAGPKSRWRRAEYYVHPDLIIEWLEALAKVKGPGLEAHIDTVGDPLMYGPKLPDLIQAIKEIPEVRCVSMQTHGSTLTEELADELWGAGLDRMNLSIDTLNPDKGRYLQGTPWYDPSRVEAVAEHVVRNTGIKLLLAPLLLHGINDADVEEVIAWGKSLGVGKNYPGFGVQVYMKHKHGRKPAGIKPLSIKAFKTILKAWEMKHGVKLILTEGDFRIKPMPTLPTPYRVGEKVRVEVIAPGWLRNEWLAVPVGREASTYVITLIDELGEVEEGVRVKARIIRNKHNIFMARPA